MSCFNDLVGVEAGERLTVRGKLMLSDLTAVIEELLLPATKKKHRSGSESQIVWVFAMIFQAKVGRESC